MEAVCRPLEAALLPRSQPIVAHQPGDAPAADREAVVPQVSGHARAAVGSVRHGEGRAHMGEQDHVFALSSACGTILKGEVAARADAENLAKALAEKLLLRRIDEAELHRLPSLAEKVAALIRISRSCRRISVSRRSRFSSAARSFRRS